MGMDLEVRNEEVNATSEATKIETSGDTIKNKIVTS